MSTVTNRGITRYTKVKGPKVGKATTKRNRNTVINNASRKPGWNQPALSPSSAAGYSQELSGFEFEKFQTLAALKTAQAQATAALNSSLAQSEVDRIAGVTHEEASSMERGLLGSSIDASNRISVEALAAMQASGARNEFQGIKQGLMLEKQTTEGMYANNVFSVLAAKAAEKAEMSISNFERDRVMRPGDERFTPRGPGPRGPEEGPDRDLATGRPIDWDKRVQTLPPILRQFLTQGPKDQGGGIYAAPVRGLLQLLQGPNADTAAKYVKDVLGLPGNLRGQALVNAVMRYYAQKRAKAKLGTPKQQALRKQGAKQINQIGGWFS